MAKRDLFLEEAVLDDLAEGYDSLELPLSEKVFRLVGAGVFIVILAVFARMLFLGWWDGEDYKTRAAINASQITRIKAERGVIFDRFGKALVKNVPDFRLNLRVVDFLKDAKQKRATAEEIEKFFNLSSGFVEEKVKNVNLEKQNSVTIVDKLTIDEVIGIKNKNLLGVEIEGNYEREYLKPEIFSHIVGYSGRASKSDLEENPDLFFDDIVGKTGLEGYYDEYLRGRDGKTAVFRNAVGEAIEKKLVENPSRGGDVYTSIDSEFQSYFYRRMQEGLNNVGSRAGVGIAVDPLNGEVLAMVSLPSFNNNEITEENLFNSFKPLFNRAVSGVYSPGSTVKPLVAVAALNERIISPEDSVFSAGYFEIPNPYFPENPSRFLDWKAHGWVNLYSAIARSSNIYFYAVGGGLPEEASDIVGGSKKIEGLGIERLKKYWQKFGFGEKTFIDLPSESVGFLPDVSLKESRGEAWRLGDTYNASIGQGDLLVTPIQLISYVSAVANGGKIYKPFIARKIVSSDGGIIKENYPEIVKDNSDLTSHIRKAAVGMMEAVKKPYGTAYMLNDLPFGVAAKTGTSQIEGKTKINAFFVGFAPVSSGSLASSPTERENPQIAVLILIENAREGGLNAVPVAKDVLNWYYLNRLNKNND